jgi:hypothetical protein
MVLAARWVFLLLLLCGMLSQQAHALAPGHDHRSASEHCCRLCHTEHPVLLSPTAPQVSTSMPVAWLPPCDDDAESRQSAVSLTPSRAPPV